MWLLIAFLSWLVGGILLGIGLGHFCAINRGDDQ
jgi:hypothetical protein